VPSPFEVRQGFGRRCRARHARQFRPAGRYDDDLRFGERLLGIVNLPARLGLKGLERVTPNNEVARPLGPRGKVL
jgi:hypothetical protein